MLIDSILDIEWEMFQNVSNIGGRASCQDDQPTFLIMRRSQFLAWDEATLSSYLDDLKAAKESGANLLTFKYAYMMEVTFPEEYENIKDALPAVEDEKAALVKKIVDVHMEQLKDFTHKYPKLMAHTRPAQVAPSMGVASIEIYEGCELKTYSINTLKLYVKMLDSLEDEGVTYPEKVYINMAKILGYQSIQEFEDSFTL